MDEFINGKEYNQHIARLLHDRGIELTPEQVIQERRAAFDTIRRELAVNGYAVPVSDEDMVRLIQEAFG